MLIYKHRILLFIVLALAFLAAPSRSFAQKVSGNFPNGSIQMGYDTSACDSTREGAIRYSSSLGYHTYCDGYCWGARRNVATPTTSGLVSWWKLDETSGTNAANSGGGNAGTLNGSPTWVSAHHNNGVRFRSASSQYISVTRSAAIETSAITVSFWFNADWQQTSTSALVVKTWQNNSANTYMSYGFYFNNWGPNQIIFATGYTGGRHLLTTVQDVRHNGWVHVAGTYNPSGGAPQKIIYINGVADNSATVTNAILYNTGGTSNLYFGRDSGTGSGYYSGIIDDVRIYNRALTATEVYTLYAQCHQ